MQQINLFRSQTFRFIAFILVGFGVFAIGALSTVIKVNNDFITEQSEQNVQTELDGLLAFFEETDYPGLVELITDRSRELTDRVYLLTAPNGDLIAGNLTLWPRQAAPGAPYFSFFYETLTADGFLREEAIGTQTELPGGYRLLVAHNIMDQRRLERHFQGVIGAVTGLYVGLGILLTLMLTTRLLGRINEINRVCLEIMQGGMGERVPAVPDNHELNELSGTINRMLDRIQRLMEAQRRTNDNIAHELRTPLNRLRQGIDVTLQSDRDAPGYRAQLETTLTGIDDLSATFNAIFQISQAQSGLGRENMMPLDLASVVAGIGDLYEPLAEERGLTFRVSIDRPAMVEGKREMLAQAVANLIDNALKYTPAGGSVEVVVQAPPRLAQGSEEAAVGASLIVRDTGPGIPSAERDRALERFVRLENSAHAPGAGLGLSLVEAIAQVHQARLALSESHPGARPPGLRVALYFPPIKSF